MEKRNGGRIEENKEKWVHDASVDYKGRVPLRASTGVWKASLFVLSKIPSLHELGLMYQHFISSLQLWIKKVKESFQHCFVEDLDFYWPPIRTISRGKVSNQFSAKKVLAEMIFKAKMH